MDSDWENDIEKQLDELHDCVTPWPAAPQQSGGKASPALDCSPFVVGDRVDCSKWDATVPPQNRIGPATVVRVWRAKCQGGIMVKVRGRGTQELAAPWLTHLSENVKEHQPRYGAGAGERGAE